MTKQDLVSKVARLEGDPASHASPEQQQSWSEASPISVQYDDTSTPAMTQMPFPTMQHSQTLGATWQPPLNTPIVPDLEPFSNSHTQNSMDSRLNISAAGEGLPDAMRDASIAPTTSPDSGTLTAEQWRKYF